MKKYIVIAPVLFLLVAAKVSAQWQPAPYTSGDIFFTGGNIGIGVTAHPVTRLRLANPNLSTETSGSGGQLAFGTTTAQWWIFRMDSGLNLHLDRQNNGWQQGLTFAHSGNVGIGTSTPAERLDVSGNILSQGVKVAAPGNAVIQTVGKWAGFVAESGDGTTSTRHSFTDYAIRETQPLTWRVGLSGSRSFSIVALPTGVSRVTLTEGGDFTVNGNISATGAIAAKYQDVAEWVPATTKMAAGTVVVLHPERPNEVMPSLQAYDTTVAGVVSAQPGLILGEAGEAKAKIATTGRVKVKVDATEAPVKIGDLLVTSDRLGYAMKSQPLDLNGRKIHQPGTVIGKALEPLTGGEGEILVLLSLQ